jgi:hypothetical protein
MSTGRRLRGNGTWGRQLLLAGVLLIPLSFAAMAVVGILGSSNIVWGEPNQYGRVDVPGTAVVHLPAGTVEVTAAVYIVGKGNETVDVPLPDDLSVTVTPAGGSAPVTVTPDVGSSGNTMDAHHNSVRRVYRVAVPADGDYTVSASGDFTGIGIHPQLWFGHGPPLPGTYVPVIGLGIVVLVEGVWLLLWGLRRKRLAASP